MSVWGDLSEDDFFLAQVVKEYQLLYNEMEKKGQRVDPAQIENLAINKVLKNRRFIGVW